MIYYNLNESLGYKDFSVFINKILNDTQKHIINKNYSYNKVLNAFNAEYVEIELDYNNPLNWINNAFINVNCCIIENDNNIHNIIHELYNDIGGLYDKSKSSIVELTHKNKNNIDSGYLLDNVLIMINVIYNINKKTFVTFKDYNPKVALSHELMHAYQHYNILLNKGKFLLDEDEYSEIVKMTESNDNNEALLGIILYHLIPEETNSFVNQFYMEFLESDYINNSDNESLNNYMINNKLIKFLLRMINDINKFDNATIKKCKKYLNQISLVIPQINENNFERLFVPLITKRIRNLINKCEKSIINYFSEQYNKGSIIENEIDYLKNNCKNPFKKNFVN